MRLTDTWLSADKINRFNEEGFVLGEQLVTEDEANVLQAEVMRVLDDKDNPDSAQPLRLMDIGSGDRSIWQIVNIWQASEAFRKVVMDSRLAEAVADMLGANEVRLWHDQIQFKPAEHGGVNNWHQDAPYWQCISEGNSITAWLALDDVDEDNGCMRMIPGSHKWGNTIDFVHDEMGDFYNPADAYQGNPLTVKSAPVPKGFVHFHHTYTYHGSGNNKCGRPRRALAMHFISEKTTFTQRHGHPCESLIDVPLGAKIEGEGFPLVYTR